MSMLYTARLQFEPAERWKYPRIIEREWMAWPLKLEGFDAHLFDARLYFKNPCSPDSEHEVTIKLLDPDAEEHFRPGAQFKVWEFGFIANGVILSSEPDDEPSI